MEEISSEDEVCKDRSVLSSGSPCSSQCSEMATSSSIQSPTVTV